MSIKDMNSDARPETPAPPPSYTASTSTSSPSHQQHPQPSSSTHLMSRTYHTAESGYLPPSQRPGHSTIWEPPQTVEIAKSRTRRRFWVAMLWGFGIYMLIGTLLGGASQDISTSNKRHKSSHGSKHHKSYTSTYIGENGSRTWKKVERSSTTFEVPVGTEVRMSSAGPTAVV